MKLNDLTKEQRAMIEDDEVGKEVLKLLGYLEEHRLSDIGWGSKWSIQSEIKRTIKRIDDEIEFLMDHYIIIKQKRKTIPSLQSLQYPVQGRAEGLIKQRALYELMEKLE